MSESPDVSTYNRISPRRIRLRPIISSMSGVSASATTCRPDTSAAANPRPTTPAHDSSAAVAVGVVALMFSARAVKAAICAWRERSTRASLNTFPRQAHHAPP